MLTAVDAFSKFAFAFPTKDCSAETAATVLKNGIFLTFGIPDQIFSDQGSHFTGAEFRELLAFFNVEHVMTPPYHQQANGICERFNATVCDMIACAANRSSWNMMVQTAVNAYNTTKHATTGISPYEVVFGMRPIMLVDRIKELKQNDEGSSLPDFLAERTTEYAKTIEQVRESLKKKRIDIPNSARQFKKGEKVWLRVFNRNQEGNKKLSDRWRGPLIITDDSHDGMLMLNDLQGKPFGRYAAKDLKVCHDWGGLAEDKPQRPKRQRKRTQRFGDPIPSEHLDGYEDWTQF